jgi:hypothetical protein
MPHEVRVRIRELGYTKIVEDELGNERLVTTTAYGPGAPQLADADPETQQYGQLIELNDEAYERHKFWNNIVDEEDVQAQMEGEGEEDEEVIDPATASVEDLARWIEQERPTVNDVVQASDGNPETAQKLLEAETQAHDGEPRKGVVDGLGVVISRG